MKKWQLTNVADHLDEIFELAESGEPQLVRDNKRQKDIYIVSAEDYRAKRKLNFIEFLLSAPKVNNSDKEIDELFARTKGGIREIDL